MPNLLLLRLYVFLSLLRVNKLNAHKLHIYFMQTKLTSAAFSKERALDHHQ